MDRKKAELRLYTGHENDTQFEIFKLHNRWQKNPATSLLNDFDHLVTLLISERFEVSDQYRDDMGKMAQQDHPSFVEPPATRLDKLKVIWESAFPTRELLIAGNRIEARNKSGSEIYHAKEMSDGERGVFHLIAEALSVPLDGVFIVDEPELHLHRSIQARLWDAVEQERPDCVIVYITHDLDFAASRQQATKIWLREYTDEVWDWAELPNDNSVPEPLLLEVVGSRKPILFVEGDRGSLDFLVFGKLFPERTVIPCGSCEAVIHSTSSFRKQTGLHHNNCCGLIDNDGRTETDIEYLKGIGVEVLPVALIENLFITESVLSFAAKTLSYEVGDATTKIKDRVFERLISNTETVISNLTRQEIELALGRFGGGSNGVQKISDAFDESVASVDPKKIYEKWQKEIERVLGEKDYVAALRYYKIKGLAAEADPVFSCRFQPQVQRWLQSHDAEKLVTTFRDAMPEVVTSIE